MDGTTTPNAADVPLAAEAAIKRTRYFWANVVLETAFTVFILGLILSWIFTAGWAAWGCHLVRAAGAAGVAGGFADWFAVTALFRNPGGLKIPHTNTIATKKDEIGKALADYVATRFLTASALRVWLQGDDRALQLAEFLCNRESLEPYVGYAQKGVVRLFELSNQDDIRAFVNDVVRSHLASMDVSSRLADLLGLLTRNDSYHEVVDAFLAELAAFVASPGNEEEVARGFKSKSPWWMRWLGISALLSKPVAHSVTDSLREGLATAARDKQHPWRRRLDAALPVFINRLRVDETLRRRVEALRDRVLGDAALTAYLSDTWDTLQNRMHNDAAAEDSTLRACLLQAGGYLGQKLRATRAVMDDINAWLPTLVDDFAPLLQTEVSKHVVSTVKIWSPEEMSKSIEGAVGDELQWIRISGTCCGAGAGVVMYLLSWGFSHMPPAPVVGHWLLHFL